MPKDYIKEIRKLVGHRKILHPAARIFLENELGEILLIKRTDNGNWGLPAGAMEEGESIEDCIKREVLEETGLQLLNSQVIGIASEPTLQTIHYPNGDVVQYVTTVFYSNQWQGNIQADGIESSAVQFFSLENFPELPANEARSISNFINFKKNRQVEVY